MNIKIWMGALAFGLLMAFGGNAFSQNSLVSAVNDPVNVTPPYVLYAKYNNIADMDEAMKQWAKEDPVACQTYVDQVMTAIKGLNMATLTAQENYYVRKRKSECEKLVRLANSN